MSTTIGFIFGAPLGALLAALLAAMLTSLEAGRALGARARASQDDASRMLASGLLAAVLGLLGLLLGFSYSLSAAHFVTNRDLVAAEATALDTAFRRADLAAEPERTALRKSLRRYIDARIAFYGDGPDEPGRRALDRESRSIHDELWRQTAAAAARAPTCTTAELVEAMNRVIEMHETRADAARNHVPLQVLWMLALMSMAALGLTGYVAALGSPRHPAPALVVLMLTAFVIVIIVDLDRPLRGLVHGGQQSLLDLRRTIGRSLTGAGGQ